MRKFSSGLLFQWLPTVFVLASSTGAHAFSDSSNKEVILGKYVVDPAILSKSLLFDQSFDKAVVRPLAYARASVAQEVAVQVATVPVVMAPAVEVVAKPAVKVPVDNAVRGSIEFSGVERPQKNPATALVDERGFDFTNLWDLPSVGNLAEPVRVSSMQTRALSPSALLMDAGLDEARGSIAVAKPDAIGVPSVPQIFQSPTPAAINPLVGIPARAVKSSGKNKEDAEKIPNASVDLPKNLFRKGPMELVLIDEESFLEAKPQVVSSATVFWGHPSLLLSTQSNTSGRALPPNKNFASARFLVQAEGYLPAVGYAGSDMITPVILIKEKRLGPVMKSLRVNPDPSRTLVWGKILDSSLQARENVKVDSSDTASKSYYSTGSFGLFHPKVKNTGSQGDFLLSSMGRQLHYLLPTEEKSFGDISELAPALLNLEGLGAVVTTTLVEGVKAKVETQVVDGLSLERPDVGIFATMGGLRGIETADEDGFLEFSQLPLRNQVDLIEVRANGYLKTWINSPARRGTFPELLSLFNRAQLNELLEGSEIPLRQNDPVVLGQLRPEIYRKKYMVEVFDSNGAIPDEYRVVYFDLKNRPSPVQDHTDQTMQTFAVLQLPTGEFHLTIRDADTKALISMQVIRVANNVVTQVQF